MPSSLPYTTKPITSVAAMKLVDLGQMPFSDDITEDAPQIRLLWVFNGLNTAKSTRKLQVLNSNARLPFES